MLTIDNIEKKSNKEKQQIAMKLHKQFGHPKSLRLIDLIKTSGITDSTFLDSMIKARRRFIETEADENLRRPLKHKTRTATTLNYQNGDQMYYKKKDSSY